MGGKSGGATIGFKYYAGVHAVPCVGPVDAVLEIRMGDREAWKGRVTTSQSISIDKPELFGGKGREGGVAGQVDLEFGEDTQQPNEYLKLNSLSMAAYNADTEFWDELRTGDPPHPGSAGILAEPRPYSSDDSDQAAPGSGWSSGGSQGTTRPPASLPDGALTEVIEEITAHEAQSMPIHVPAYRGVLGMVFRTFMWASYNPYLKPFAVRVERILKGWGADGVWYAEKAGIKIGDYWHANPAHIIYQALTNKSWGMKYPRSQLDDASFRAAADKLYEEGFGLSLLWRDQTSIKAFTQLVLDHINGVLTTDLRTGLIKLRLVRDDYVAADLVEFNENNVIALLSFQRKSWGETVNELTVTFTDVVDGNKKPVTVQDLGNIRTQGSTVTDSREYVGIPTQELAYRVAMRDLRVLAAPLASLSIRVNRTGWRMEPGEVFRFSWAELGLTNIVFRVLEVDLGTLEDGSVTIHAVEDVFGMPSGTYAAPQPGGWARPSDVVPPVTQQMALEAPYYDVARRLEPYQIAELDPNFGFATLLARRPSGTAINYSINYSANNSSFTRIGAEDFTPHALLLAPLTRLATTATLIAPRDLDNVSLNSLAYITSGSSIEAVEVVALNAETGEVTIKRGVLDTVPQEFPAGAHLWFAGEQRVGYDETERVWGETAYYKLTARTGAGEATLAQTASISVTFDRRFQRPYAPGNVRVNGTHYPAKINGALALTWSHRDRTQQLAGLVGFVAGNIGPEPGVTYNLRAKHPETGALLYQTTGITGTAWDDKTGAGPTGTVFSQVTNSVRIELESSRDGLVSWQKHDLVVERYGYGFRYGDDYGGG